MAEAAPQQQLNQPPLTYQTVAPSKARPFDLVAVRDIPEIVEQQWLVRGLIPRFDEGAAGYLFGPPKSRKSLLASEIALSVATGAPVLGRFEVVKQGGAVGFFAEDPKGETARRIRRLARGKGVDVPSNLLLLDAPRIALDAADHKERLLATLSSIPDLAFVWLDPMVRLHSINDNRAEELGPIHTYLRSLVRQLPGVVLMLSHHTNKSGGSRGSTEYDAFGDFNIFLRSTDPTTTTVVRIENRGGPPGDPFTFSAADDVTPEGRSLQLLAVPTLSEAGEHPPVGQQLSRALHQLKAAEPGISGKAAMTHLRERGVRFRNEAFWSVWKTP